MQLINWFYLSSCDFSCICWILPVRASFGWSVPQGMVKVESSSHIWGGDSSHLLPSPTWTRWKELCCLLQSTMLPFSPHFRPLLKAIAAPNKTLKWKLFIKNFASKSKQASQNPNELYFGLHMRVPWVFLGGGGEGVANIRFNSSALTIKFPAFEICKVLQPPGYSY